MKTMGDRLKEALQQRGLTPPDLISATKLSKGTVYNILNDTTQPEKVWSDTADKVCNVLRVRRDWLLHGRGEMNAISEFLESPPMSHSQRIDPTMLAESIAALRQVAKNRGWEYDPETHPQETVYAYELRIAMPALPATAEVIDFGERVAQRLQQLRRSDGQENGEQAGTAHRKRS